MKAVVGIVALLTIAACASSRPPDLPYVAVRNLQWRHEPLPIYYVDVDALLASWQDDDAETVESRFTVVLGDVPTDLLIAAKAHIDNLVREFTLAASADEAVPKHLARLIETVVHGFAEARDAFHHMKAAQHMGKIVITIP